MQCKLRWIEKKEEKERKWRKFEKIIIIVINFFCIIISVISIATIGSRIKDIIYAKGKKAGYVKGKVEGYFDGYEAGQQQAQEELRLQIDDIVTQAIETERWRYFSDGVVEGDCIRYFLSCIQENEKIPEEIKIEVKMEYLFLISNEDKTIEETEEFIFKMLDILELYEGEGLDM